ncbi:MAG: UDP-N-acetylmuramoyl-L-alanine--D-glutamate ligase [Firmicutes bacterium]|nr:UDP-N-acetylmuramoyl-L-alanine--D-glutamate ligase [Bacillota bacterium]
MMKKALILGKGISGSGAAEALQSLGYNTKIFDDSDGGKPPKLTGISIVVHSPGVPITHPTIQEAKQKNIDTMGELELGYRLCRCPLVAITGTNGKTTVTRLLHRILANRGLRTDAVGNVGKSLASASLKSNEYDVLVCETSSFQLESITSFAPEIAMITNISPDHLDRHGTMDEYAKTKLKIAQNQTEKNFLILSMDDIPIKYLEGFAPRSHVLFVSTKRVVAGAYLLDGKLYYFDEVICDRSNLKLQGDHNVSNALFAAAAARIMGVDRTVIAQTFADFELDDHRLQFIGTYGGKRYYDDSKGTNIDACLKACESMQGDTALILGGSDKGYDFGRLFDELPTHITYITAIGETATAIKSIGAIYAKEVIICDSLEEAVECCSNSDIQNVLLSPATASYDMFKDYKERGERFAEIVKNMGQNE